MYELVRGYASCVFDDALSDDALAKVVSDLEAAVRAVVLGNEHLREVMTDPVIPAAARGAVVSELLEPRVRPEVVALSTFTISSERAGELPRSFEQLLQLGEERLEHARRGDSRPGEPPIGRSGALARLRGFTERIFEGVEDKAVVDTIEDELFSLARLAENTPELRRALAAQEPEAPLEARLEIVDDLFSEKVRPETLRLVGYVLRARRARDLVGALDFLVELAAAEQGRRVAEVHAAVALDDEERERLSDALSRRMRRPVELRVLEDPSVIGGLDISVGDTVIDGTVRHRLEQLRETLFAAR